MEVILNEAEQKIAKFIGKLRKNNAEGQGYKSTPYGRNIDIIEAESVAAEMAFCKLANLYPDLSPGEKDNDADATTYYGKTVDVKQTPYQDGHLLVKPVKKIGDVDYYVLMIGEMPTFRFAGFVSEHDIIKPGKIKQTGYTNSYSMDQEELEKDLNKLLAEKGGG